MVRTLRAATCAAALVLATGAHATDLRAGYPAVPVATPGWNGLYVGVQAGYSQGRDTTREYLTSPWMFIGLQNSYRPDGFLGGLHFGGNIQVGQLVLGAEMDAELANIAGGFVDPPAPPFNPGGRGRTELDAQGSLRARVGMAFDSTLVYATGGLVVARHRSTYWNWGGVEEHFTRTRAGWTLGLGVEQALGPSWTVRAEYRYTDLGLFRNHSQIAFPGFSGTQEPEYHTGRVGLSFRF